MSSNSFDVDLDIPSDLGTRNSLGQNPLLCPQEVLKLKYSTVVVGEVLLRIPDCCPEALETAIFLEPNPGLGVPGGVHLVREHGLQPRLSQPLQFIHLLAKI